MAGHGRVGARLHGWLRCSQDDAVLGEVIDAGTQPHVTHRELEVGESERGREYWWRFTRGRS